MIKDEHDLYNSKIRFKRWVKAINDWDTSNKNKKLVKEFMEELGADGISFKRRGRYLTDLKKMAQELLKKDFDKVTKEDIRKFMNFLRGSKYTRHTINEFIKTTKKFYKVMFGDNEEIPSKYRFIKSIKYINGGVRDERYKEQPITIEEIKAILNTTSNMRDKVLVSLIFEGCLRPSEALTIKIKDVQEIDKGYKINVYGKTGFRPIFLHQTSPYLRELLGKKKKDKESYLFVNVDGKQLGYRRADYIFKEMMERARVKKKNNLYWLRHSGITYKRILGISDSALTNFAGWIPGTNQLKIYSHLTGDEMRDEVAKLYGAKEEKEIDKITQKYCNVCKNELGFGDDFCRQCGVPITQKAVRDVKTYEKVLLSNEETKKVFVEEIKEELLKDLRAGNIKV